MYTTLLKPKMHPSNTFKKVSSSTDSTYNTFLTAAKILFGHGATPNTLVVFNSISTIDMHL